MEEINITLRTLGKKKNENIVIPDAISIKILPMRLE